MSLKLRLALLLGLLLLAFLVAMVTLRQIEARQTEQVLVKARQDRVEILERWIDLTEVSLRQFADDYSQWDDMATFLAKADPAWAAINLEASLPNFNAHAIWVLRRDGALVYGYNRLKLPTLNQPPLPRAEFLALCADTPFTHFFATSSAGLLELRGAPIQPSADTARTTPALGWLVVARLWDPAHLKTLRSLTESKIGLAEPTAQLHPAQADNGSICILRPLSDWKGRPIQLLHIDCLAPELAQIVNAGTLEGRVFAGFGLLVIISLAISLQSWVLRPLGWIGDSLARGDPSPIRPIRRDNNELGRVAQLIETSFAQKAELVREVEERKHAEAALRRSEEALRQSLQEQAQLGRDLHDGVIQSLYAAGMGLSGIRQAIRTAPADAEERLERTRAMLNETIRDVRNFITGLEPEALKRQTFRHAVDRLVEVMQSISPLRATVEIDETLAERLTLAQRAHALQIAREAMSNALRHGAASAVTLAMRSQGERVEFVVDDNGQGFDPAALREQGHGLHNLADRARELGGELALQSEPGKGTRVTLRFPLSLSTSSA
ncbi:MAG: ATP-binding protein [Opitutae bacterium]|nr:ATP-binding protein [Opitutae bacterium]